MVFNKKKKGDHLKPLSEKEIQDKLYGVFQAANGQAGGAALPVKNASVPAASAVSVEETPTSPAPPPDLFKAAEASEPQSVPAAAASTKTESPLPAVSERPSEKISEKALVLELKNERRLRDYQMRMLEWADEDTPKPSVAVKIKARHTPQPSSVASSKPFLKTAQESAATFFPKMLQSLKEIDLNDPKNRQLMYWGGAFLFLLIVLVGINSLNVKREEAMKMPRKKIVVVEDVPSVNESAPENKQKSVRGVGRTEAAPSAEQAPAPAQNEPSKTKVDKPIAGAAVNYEIQVATYAMQADAERLVSRFRDEKWPAFLKALNRSSGKLYYCVFLGPFSDYEGADKTLKDFKKKESSGPFQDAFIRSS